MVCQHVNALGGGGPWITLGEIMPFMKAARGAVMQRNRVDEDGIWTADAVQS
jgi:hypothetical protein